MHEIATPDPTGLLKVQYPDLILYECDSCGATLSDPDLHTEWHAQLRVTLGLPKPGYEPYRLVAILNDINIEVLHGSNRNFGMVNRTVAERLGLNDKLVTAAIFYGRRHGMVNYDPETAELRSVLSHNSLAEPPDKVKGLGARIVTFLYTANSFAVPIFPTLHTIRTQAQAELDENPDSDPKEQVDFQHMTEALHYVQNRGAVNVDTKLGMLSQVGKRVSAG